MFIFRKESQILRNVNFFYCNKRCLRSDTLQHALCLVAERTIRFRVKLELHRFGSQSFNCTLRSNSVRIAYEVPFLNPPAPLLQAAFCSIVPVRLCLVKAKLVYSL